MLNNLYTVTVLGIVLHFPDMNSVLKALGLFKQPESIRRDKLARKIKTER